MLLQIAARGDVPKSGASIVGSHFPASRRAELTSRRAEPTSRRAEPTSRRAEPCFDDKLTRGASRPWSSAEVIAERPDGSAMIEAWSILARGRCRETQAVHQRFAHDPVRGC